MKKLEYEIINDSEDIKQLKIKFSVIIEQNESSYSIDESISWLELINVEDIYTEDKELANYLFGVDYKYKNVYVLTEVIAETIEDFLDSSNYYDNYKTDIPTVNDKVVLEKDKKYLVTLTSEFVENDFYENSEDCLIKVIEIDLI